ncbi:MAG: SEC-C domain-containing protein, partial [Actinobacteria bacterium]|nr:SEC-C domain-containing protein [Actinomycetota bacterium]
MGKRAARSANASTPIDTGAEVPVVGLREPCPCGSGRRYKACHGKEQAGANVVSSRPFEGLASECDIVALRELVPSATAPLTLKDGRVVTLATVLPMAWPALVRQDGEIMLGLQVNTGTGDASRDLGSALE